MRFTDKVVVITGASRGIGKAIAIAFANEGAKLVLCYRQQHDAIEQLAIELKQKTDVISVAGDLGLESTADQIVQATLNHFGKADILVNNAGAIIGHGTVTPENFDQGMRINLLGTIMLTQKFTPILKKQPGSNIVNISSTFGILGAAPVAIYTAAKAGMLNYTKSMAVELAPHIRVNAIAPGIIDTDMTTAAGPDLISHFVNTTPMKRLGKPDEIAKSVLFLASDDASFITGHTLISDGGHILVN